MGLHSSMHKSSPRPRCAKHQNGGCGYVPVSSLPLEAFTPTFELEPGEWPDFLAGDIADWPCRQRQIGVCDESAGQDVALILAFPDLLPPRRKIPGLRLLRHQTSGFRRREFRCAGIRLQPTPTGQLLGLQLATRWHRSAAAISYTALDELSRYRGLLQEHGLDCNASYAHFAEGVYPVDFDDAAVDLLVSVESRGAVRLLQTFDAGCLAFLAPNSGCDQ
jgi:hypothetical protein